MKRGNTPEGSACYSLTVKEPLVLPRCPNNRADVYLWSLLEVEWERKWWSERASVCWERGWKAGVMFLWGWPGLYSASLMFIVEQIDPLLFSTPFVNHNFIHVHSIRQFTLRFSTMVCNTKLIFNIIILIASVFLHVQNLVYVLTYSLASL